jgi:hypothetical protein
MVCLNEIKEIIEKSNDFLNLKKKYPSSFLYAVFSILTDEKFNRDFDYYLNIEEVAIFSYSSEKIEMKISKLDVDMVKDTKKPAEVKGKIILEPEIVAEIIAEEIKKQKVVGSISKIILTLMNDKKLIWKSNCILTTMDILQVDISDSDKKVIKFEKKNLTDFVKYMKK